jgi:hypothetical protein
MIRRTSKIVGKHCPNCHKYIHVHKDDAYIRCSSCKELYAVNWRIDNEVTLVHRPGYTNRPSQELTLTHFLIRPLE